MADGRFGEILSSLALVALQSLRRNAANDGFEAFTPGTFGMGAVDYIESGDSPYTIVATDEIVFCDTDGGDIIANLPAGTDGRRYKIINCGSSGNDVTLNANGAETIAGDASQTLYDGEVLDLHYEATKGWY